MHEMYRKPCVSFFHFFASSTQHQNNLAWCFSALLEDTKYEFVMLQSRPSGQHYEETFRYGRRRDAARYLFGVHEKWAGILAAETGFHVLEFSELTKYL